VFKSGSLQANEDEEWSQVFVINIHTFVFVGNIFDLNQTILILKRKLRQFHQYHQNEQPFLISNH
jgi:hypothetical protein